MLLRGTLALPCHLATLCSPPSAPDGEVSTIDIDAHSLPPQTSFLHQDALFYIISRVSIVRQSSLQSSLRKLRGEASVRNTRLFRPVALAMFGLFGRKKKYSNCGQDYATEKREKKLRDKSQKILEERWKAQDRHRRKMEMKNDSQLNRGDYHLLFLIGGICIVFAKFFAILTLVNFLAFGHGAFILGRPGRASRAEKKEHEKRKKYQKEIAKVYKKHYG